MDEFFNKLLGVDVDFSEMIQFYALLLARIAPAIFQTPFLGGEVVQNEVKVGISMILIVFFTRSSFLPCPTPCRRTLAATSCFS